MNKSIGAIALDLLFSLRIIDEDKNPRADRFCFCQSQGNPVSPTTEESCAVCFHQHATAIPICFRYRRTLPIPVL
jgi:hypothetical protein